MRGLLGFLAIAPSCLLSASAYAQVSYSASIVVPASSPTQAQAQLKLLRGLNANGNAAVVTSSGAQSASKTQKQTLLQQFQKQKFDRRPSAILKAWSTPIKEEQKTKKEGDSKKSDANKKTEGKKEENESDAKKDTVADKSNSSTATPEKKDAEDNTPGKKATGKKAPGAKLTPKQATAAAAAKAVAAAKKAQEEAKKAAEEQAAIQKKLQAFSRDVTLSNWSAVKEFLTKEFNETEASQAYQHLLRSLQDHGADVSYHALSSSSNLSQQLQSTASSTRVRQELNVFSPVDVIALADAAPGEIKDETITLLGSILRRALGQGHTIESFIKLLNEELAKPEPDQILTKIQGAELLVSTGNGVKALPFLPTLDESQKAKDAKALLLIAKYHLALFADKNKDENLETAWRTIQLALAIKVEKPEHQEAGSAAKLPRAPEPKENKQDEKVKLQLAKDKKARQDKIKRQEKYQTEAFQLAIGLAPRVRKQLGEAWLKESCTGDPEMGIRILGTVGEKSARGMSTQPQNPHSRLQALKLQKTAAEALLDAVPDRAAEWQSTLNLLATSWLNEAELSHRYATSTSMGPVMQRDRYGNMFWHDFGSQGQLRSSGNRRFRAIDANEILETAPNESWQKLLPASLKPQFDAVHARLYLKVNESEKAFPFIESLAAEYPRQAHELAEEFLRVWTRNHDPNSDRRRTNSYMFMFGFERRAEGIPLTRSKQERNLEKLSQWVKRLGKLPIEPIDEKLLVNAFTTCHSSAEVYRLDALEQVFGSIDLIEPKTLSGLLQKTRGNLAGIWRVPATQKDKKTNRKKKDIQREVLKGYDLARQLLDRALKKYPDDWSLHLANACLTLDKLNYQQDLAVSSDYVEQREKAFVLFQKAAQVYAAQVESLEENEQSTDVYDHWFYASLGASDLGQIDAIKQPDLKQPLLIREAIFSLREKAREWHHGRFANNLFTRMSSAKPELKFRYLRTGFEIVGEHKQAYEAKKVFDYYNDLVTEIKLAATIDGSDVVGHEKPFGLFIDLEHTREIERESGGFSRYLQNQNNQRYSYNYGRPTENYRDKFEEAARLALQEHFEILSVTFQTEDVNSRALEQYGWRATPYAYILLKARGPEVDKIPSLRLDLDFLDTSGYAILPIESSPVALDAAPAKTESRPIQNLEVTQTLDERQANEGRLLLEIKAVGQGLVPDLEDLLEVKSEGFKIVGTEDEGVSVSRFDPESEENVVVSERIWSVEFQANENLAERPTEFHFGNPKLELNKVSFQRYNDADLMEVEQLVSLDQQYGETSFAWQWLAAAGGICLLLFVGLFVWLLRRKPVAAQEVSIKLPEHITPFTVLGLLNEISENNGFDSDSRRELASSINHLEDYYFVSHEGDDPDLEAIASDWVGRASPVRLPR